MYQKRLKLRNDIITLLATLGKQATNLYTDERNGRLGDNPNYTIRFYEDTNKTKFKDFYIIEDGYRWIKIKSINIFPLIIIFV